MAWKKKLKLFQELSKSGIVTLVLISVLGGYFLGHPFEVSLSLSRLFLTLLAVLFLASGSSALNQYQERTIDSQMPRTANRPLPSGRLTPKEVLWFIGVNLTLGLILLAMLAWNLFFLGLAAVFLYNGFYTLWWKRKWAYAAVPGAIPGALPILMGHVAAQGKIWDPGAIYLFFILFFWQMPHFWALALRYEQDYQRGGVPTLPVARGSTITIYQITVWCLAYVGLAMLAPLFLHVGWVYWIPSFLMSVKVLRELKVFAKDPKSNRWLHFFLWVNFSLILFLGAAVLDLWSVYIPIPSFTR